MTTEHQDIPRSWVYLSLTDRFSIPYDQIREAQLQALRQAFRTVAQAVPVVRRLAAEQGINDIQRLEDAGPLILRNATYKSYPLALIEKGRYDQLLRWLGGLTVIDLSGLDASGCGTIDEWIGLLERETEIRVLHSSGTSGKLSFLPRSESEVRLMVEVFRRHSEGFGDEPDAGPIQGIETMPILFPNYRHGAMEAHRLIDGFVRYIYGGDQNMVVALYPGRMSADLQSLGGRIKGAEARGELGRMQLAPQLMERREAFLREQADAPRHARAFFDECIERLRGQRVIVLSQGWGHLFDMAAEARRNGISRVFAPSSLVMVGGGTKNRSLPADYQEIVREFLGTPHMRDGYGMSECLASTKSCPLGKYHMQPWIVPFLLDSQTGQQLPRSGTQRGHLGLIDLLPRTYWGGFWSGDEVTLYWGDSEPCPCGRQGPYIDGNIRRFSEKDGGDDKITCAGAMEAHDRALSFIHDLE